MLSPIAAAAFEEKVITSLCEFTDPESIWYPDRRRVPTRSQTYPVAAVVAVVAMGKAGAV
jgi:hypothetical protein